MARAARPVRGASSSSRSPPLYSRPNAWARLQQHCIGVNGSFFNTHRMLGQYFNNAYFPQMSEEQAIPVASDLLKSENPSKIKESALV